MYIYIYIYIYIYVSISPPLKLFIGVIFFYLTQNREVTEFLSHSKNIQVYKISERRHSRLASHCLQFGGNEESVPNIVC